MKTFIKRCLAGFFYVTGLSWLAFYYQFHLRKKALVLLYHQICPPENSYQPAVSSELFEQQIRFIKERFEIISVENLLGYLKGKTRYQKPPAVITFDDGYRDNYEAAYPILKKYQAPATVFLAAASIDGGDPMWTSRVDTLFDKAPPGPLTLAALPKAKTYSLKDQSQKMKACHEIKTEMKQVADAQRLIILRELEEKIGLAIGKEEPAMLSWEEIRKMSEDPLIEFGSHSVSHRMLARLPIKEVRRELEESRNTIEAQTGRRVRFFSYPGNSHNAAVRQCARETGYEAAFSVDRSLCEARSDRHQLKRVHIENEPFYVFLAEISLVMSFFRKISGRNHPRA